MSGPAYNGDLAGDGPGGGDGVGVKPDQFAFVPGIIVGPVELPQPIRLKFALCGAPGDPLSRDGRQHAGEEKAQCQRERGHVWRAQWTGCFVL